ncbi:MAG TPA: Holliday junction branch migration protein RuvA [bacterium]|nr:Holliday junction branch migration protein RuvA [bacterium]HPQ66101.1 Holliday junction branch migration protein RuvA [bacterium]
MIEYIRGTLEKSGTDYCVIEAGGIGYRIYISPSTRESLPPEGEPIKLHVFHQVREAEQTLFGFSRLEERVLFELLLGVSQVGPRLALSVLSGLAPALFRQAVLREDAALISSVRGVGKKTAERIVLELRDKVAALPIPTEAAGGGEEKGRYGDVIAALVSLGFGRTEAAAALDRVAAPARKNLGAGELVRLCLASLGERGGSDE